MNKEKYPIPILLIVFKRKNYLPKILTEIVKTNPSIVYVFQDGPRNQSELKDILAVRNYVKSFFDKHSINYKLKYESKNLGVALAEVKAIDWVFKINKEKYLVSIEDDCIVDKNFFYFMEKILPQYYKNERFLAVNSCNFYSNLYQDLKYPFFLSRFFVPWAFGIWRRSWLLYDFDLKDFNKIRKRIDYKSRFLNSRHKFYLESYFKSIFEKKLKTNWDVQLTYLAYKYNKYFLTPKKNLSLNLGQNLQGSNPFLWQDIKEIESFNEDIVFPKKIKYEKKYDELYFENRLRGGWFRLLGIYIYNNFLTENLKKLLVQFLKIIINKK